CSVEELADLVPAGFRGELRRASVAELFPAPATCVADGETVVVLGSLYLVGEVLARLCGQGLPDAWQDRLPPVR
ncbi:MAG: bifunctional folylpolyglutamate synthase/dihydrofolate synthase, partial [Verrucomicrobiota bacterium]